MIRNSSCKTWMAKIIFFSTPTQIKQIHKSYCTEVLQSANIMNCHELVYTRFIFWMTKIIKMHDFFFFFCPVRLRFHDAQIDRLMLRSRWTVSRFHHGYAHEEQQHLLIMFSVHQITRKVLPPQRRHLPTRRHVTSPQSFSLHENKKNILILPQKPKKARERSTCCVCHAEHADSVTSLLVLLRCLILFLLMIPLIFVGVRVQHAHPHGNVFIFASPTH